jgi:outer membrane protein TolC|tara:strand:- start:307 stop:495 length:189 start_codon:yes stop_codon:yes gene_type:complete
MKSRVRGIEAQKANIQAAKAVARTLRSSLGPKVRATTKKSRRENPQPPSPTTLPPAMKNTAR